MSARQKKYSEEAEKIWKHFDFFYTRYILESLNRDVKFYLIKNHAQEFWDSTIGSNDIIYHISGDLDVSWGLEKLIEFKVNINTTNPLGWTRLMSSIFKGDDDIVNALLEVDADVNVTGHGKVFGLWLACQHCFLPLSTFEKLIKITDDELIKSKDWSQHPLVRCPKKILYSIRGQKVSDYIKMLTQHGVKF